MKRWICCCLALLTHYLQNNAEPNPPKNTVTITVHVGYKLFKLLDMNQSQNQRGTVKRQCTMYCTYRDKVFVDCVHGVL